MLRMMMPNISMLNVLLHDKLIGTLTFLPGEQTLFSFNQAYIEDQGRPVLSLSYKGAMGELITDFRPTKIKVPPFFSNLLPEGHLRDYLAAIAGMKSQREFFLLWILGQDLPGAVRIEPADGHSLPPTVEKQMNQEEMREHDILRFSLAGVQLKFSAVMESTGGLTIPAQGIGGAWILKLPSSRFQNVPENEYSMMMLAKKIGIDVPDVDLISLDKINGLPREMARLGGDAYIVRRFDRNTKGAAVHIEDFAQVFNVFPDKKYNQASYRNIAEVLWIETGEKGIAEYVRRLVFNTLIGNADMHLKNWSLIYPDKRTAELAPSYDFVSTIPYLADDSMALKYVKTKKMSGLTFDELAYLAVKARLPEKLVIDTAQETVNQFKEIWLSEQTHLPLSKETIESISRHVKTIPIAAC